MDSWGKRGLWSSSWSGDFTSSSASLTSTRVRFPLVLTLVVSVGIYKNYLLFQKKIILPECFSGFKQKLLAFIGEKMSKPLKGWFAKNTIFWWKRNSSLVHSYGVTCILSEITKAMFFHHAKDAITFSPNRFRAELWCLVWALRSMKDLGYHEVVIGFDFREVTEAVRRPKDWPRFRIILREIDELCSLFRSVAFETESVFSNQKAREIALSVLRDGRGVRRSILAASENLRESTLNCS